MSELGHFHLSTVTKNKLRKENTPEAKPKVKSEIKEKVVAPAVKPEVITKPTVNVSTVKASPKAITGK